MSTQVGLALCIFSCSFASMDEVVKTFLEGPSEQLLDKCSRDQLLKLVDHYKIDLGDRRVKETVRANLKLHLFKIRILSTVKQMAAVSDESFSPIAGPGLSFEQQKELLALRMKLEMEKELSLEKIKQETELVKLELERQKLQLVREGRVMSDVLTDRPVVFEGNQGRPDTVNDLSDLRLVPKFNERDPETFFLMFERLADARG